MAKKTQTPKAPAAKAPAAKGMDITTAVGKKLADALKAKATPAAEKPAPKDTNLGPNAQFPFGIKLTDGKGNVTWERFKTGKERDTRNATLKGKRVDYALNPEGATPNGPSKITSTPDPGPAAAPAAPAKPAAKPAAAPKPKGDTLALHLNKTGRLCFGKDAAARLSAYFPGGFMAIECDGKGLIRLQPMNKHAEGALPIRDGSGRPYISVTKQAKPCGFDGTEARDIDAKPYGNAGFEFRLS